MTLTSNKLVDRGCHLELVRIGSLHIKSIVKPVRVCLGVLHSIQPFSGLMSWNCPKCFAPPCGESRALHSTRKIRQKVPPRDLATSVKLSQASGRASQVTLKDSRTHKFSGWWYTNPSEKYIKIWKSVGMMIEKYEFVSWDDDSSQYEWKVIIQMFQTTNQFCNGSFSTSQFQQILTIPHVAEGSRRTAKFFISLQWRYRFCPVVWLLFYQWMQWDRGRLFGKWDTHFSIPKTSTSPK